MKGLGAVLPAVLAAMALSVVGARADEDDWPVLKTTPLETLRPWGAFAHYGAGPAGKDPYALGVTLYAAGQGEGAYLIARRVHAQAGITAVEWTTSRSCKGLTRLAERLERLPLPRIDAPGVGKAQPSLAGRDRDSYHLWVDQARWPGHHGASLELRATNDSPLAAWVDEALAGLNGCWRYEAPRLP